MKKHVLIAVSAIALLGPQLCAAQMDKPIHTSAAFGITITISAATNKPKLGLLAGLGASAGKELWDSGRPGHQASFTDFAAGAAGSASAFVLWKYVLNRKSHTIAHSEQGATTAPVAPPADGPEHAGTAAAPVATQAATGGGQR